MTNREDQMAAQTIGPANRPGMHSAQSLGSGSSSLGVVRVPSRRVQGLAVLSLAFLAPLLLAACSSGSSSEEVATDAGTHELSDPGVGGIETAAADEIETTDAGDTFAANPENETNLDENTNSDSATTEIATLGAGCYWCVEAVLEQIEGIQDVVSGFMGGKNPNPTYEEVCTGRTGHAEVVQVTFDPSVIPYEHVLAWFWRLHDPTTLNRQGADVGTQYRSVIFYHSEAQRETALKSLEAAQPEFSDPIVTEISPASELYVAKEEHQDYYRANKSQGYCRTVIAPKLEKLNLEK